MKAQEYMNRNMGGQVMPPIVYQQEGSFGNKIINQLPGFLQDILRSDQPNYRTDDSEASDIAYGPRDLNVVETEAIINDNEPSYKDFLMSSLVEKYAGKPSFKKKLYLGDETEDANSLSLSSPLSKILQGSRDEKGNLSLDRINKEYLALTGQAAQDGKEVKPKTAKNKKDAEPVKVGTSGKYPKNPDLADNEPGSNKESLNEMYKARVAKAANVEKNTMVTIAQKVQEQSGSDGITTIRKAFETYNKDVRAFIDKDPYRQQKFWATIGAAIMQPGNAFANMAKGFKQAVDGLDASDKKKNELLMALTGKRFDTEVAVGGIQEKRSESLKDRIKDLNIAISKASGEVRKELIKQKAKILAADRLRNSKRSTKLLESTDAEIYDLVKATYSGLSKSKQNRLDEQLKKFGGGDKAWYQTGNNKKDIADWVRNQINRGKNFKQITEFIKE